MALSVKNNATWTFDADGNGAAEEFMHQRQLEFAAGGDFGGGTVKLQAYFAPSDEWYDIPSMSLTSTGAKSPINVSQGEKLRPVLSGATDPDLTVLLKEVVT